MQYTLEKDNRARIFRVLNFNRERETVDIRHVEAHTASTEKRRSLSQRNNYSQSCKIEMRGLEVAFP